MTAMIQNRNHRVRPARCGERGRRSAKTLQPNAQQRDRARKLLDTEISFIPNASFRRANADRTILSVANSYSPAATIGNSAWVSDLPPHLARLSEAPLLTAEQEQDLFRRMNYLKYKANSFRATLDPDALDVAALERAEHLLDEAQSIRNQIVRANVRLVMAVVKKFNSPTYSFDEMLSDGLLTLMKAVEKFDYSRGFRFSTYAYRALLTNTYRCVTSRANRDRHFAQASDSVLDVVDEREPSSPDLSTWQSLRGTIAEMLDQLDPREKLIVVRRFAIGSREKSQSLQSLAGDLGVSKERIRQLEQRALSKLHTIASEMGLDVFLENEFS